MCPVCVFQVSVFQYHLARGVEKADDQPDNIYKPYEAVPAGKALGENAGAPGNDARDGQQEEQDGQREGPEPEVPRPRRRSHAEKNLGRSSRINDP